jgi:parallel beta-helix repeat protein
LIQDCTFAHNGYGINLQGAANNNLIEDNEFYDSIYDWSWDAVKANHDSTGQGREAGGIYFNSPHPSRLQVMPRGTVIRRNTFHDLFDGFGICTFETPAYPSNETDVYENYIYRAGDDGMETDGYCSNVRIFNNIFHDVLVGISLAPVQIGPTYVIGNLVFDIGRPGGCPFGKEGPCGGTGLKVQYGDLVSGPIYLFHNTFDGGTKDYSTFIVEDTGWPMLVSRNNTWGSSRSGGLEVDVDDPLDFDYDNIFSIEDRVLVHWLGQDFYSFDHFKKTMKQEMNGISVDPKFADINNGDYSLHPNSSLIDAGILLPGINHHFLGLRPDIGAFEYVP